MSNNYLHTFIYQTPARRKCVMFRVSLTAENGYEAIAHTVVNQVRTTSGRRRAVDLKDALQVICEMAEPYIKKNYKFEGDAPTPRDILADMATVAAVVFSASAASGQPRAAMETLIAPIRHHFISGDVMVPVLL